MVRRRFFASFAAAATVLALLLTSSPAFAAASSGAGNALSISPVRQDLVIKAGATDIVDVYVQNLTAQTITLQGIVNDFTASTDESGAPAIILNPNQYAPSHSLKHYVAPLGDFTLKANQREDVKVTIAIPKGTAGGGYYGAIRFVSASSSSGKNVTLSASVGSLILVTVPGNLKEDVNVSGFDVEKESKSGSFSPGSFFLSNKSLDGVVRFQNEGNVQEEPFGTIILKKGNKVLGTYQVNNTTPRGNVLPDSIRKFSIPLTHLGSFGKYTLEGNFGYGTTGQLLTASTTFYIVPGVVIATAIIVVLLILFAIFGLPRMIRAYNRNVIRNATAKNKRK